MNGRLEKRDIKMKGDSFFKIMMINKQISLMGKEKLHVDFLWDIEQQLTK